MKRAIALVGMGLVGLLGAGCAQTARTEHAAVSTPAVTDAEIQTLRQRAATYWNARMAGDDKTQWELLEPRGRGRLTPQEYAAERKGIRYLGYQVEDATVDGHFATVKVRLLFQPILPRMTSVPVQTLLMDDHWVRVGGAWYRQFDDRRPPTAQQ
jgi:hypothetical protein